MPTQSRFFAGLLLFLVTPVPAARGDGTPRPPLESKDIEPLLRTDWYGVYLKEKKIGYFRKTRARDGMTLRESGTFSMKLASFGQKVELRVDEVLAYEGKAPYRLIRAEKDQRNDPTPPEKSLLVRTAQGFDFTFRTGMEVSKKQVADIDYTFADAVAGDVWIRRGPGVGDKIVTNEFDIKEVKSHAITSRILTSKTSLAGGVGVRYYEVENEDHQHRIKYLTRHDESGRMLSGVLIIFELRLETEEQAKNTEYSQDLFELGLVKSDRPLGPTKNVTELVVQVDAKEGALFEDGPRQSVGPGPNGSRILKLGKKYGHAAPATKKEIEENLAETTTYFLSHPKVKALAARAVGDAGSDEEKVRRIVQFVNGFIRPSLRANTPTIHDLMDKKEGDCKSYALLVTTLGGLPACPPATSPDSYISATIKKRLAAMPGTKSCSMVFGCPSMRRSARPKSMRRT